MPYFDGVALEEGPAMGGIGGGIGTFRVRDVHVLFPRLLDDCLEMHEEVLDSLYVPAGRATSIPNLLGRDLLGRFDLHWSQALGTIEMNRTSTPGGRYSVRYLELPAGSLQP